MRRYSFEYITGALFFIVAVIINTINFSMLQNMNTSYDKIQDLEALKNMVFELSAISQNILVSTLLITIGLIFLILGIINQD